MKVTCSYSRYACFTSCEDEKCVDVCAYCNLYSFVRVWKSGGESSVFKAHTPAVWTVAGLFRHDGTRRILSGKRFIMFILQLNVPL